MPSGLRSWNFQATGGGLQGPFTFDAYGLMFLGATVPSTGGASLENIQIRVHPGFKPIQATKNTAGFPSLFADGIPLTAGQWFSLGDKESLWNFSVPDQVSAEEATYWFMVIEGCGFNSNALQVDPNDLIAGSGATGSSASGSLAGAVAELAAAGPHDLRGWFFFNEDAATAFVQIFDAAAAGDVTVGTTVPDLSFGIPAGAAANVLSSAGKHFSKGIVLAATTTRAGGVAPGAPVDFNVFF